MCTESFWNRENKFYAGKKEHRRDRRVFGLYIQGKDRGPLKASAVNNVIYNVGGKYNKEEVIRDKKEHRKAELLPKISIQNIWHTACTNMTKHGMNIKVLQYLMGHANSDVMLDVYDHFGSKQDVREEVERYALEVGG